MSLPVSGLLAVRYLKSARRDAYVTFLSLLAAGGIALGVAALVLVLAALSGLQAFLREDVLARTPHMEIELPDGTDPAPLIDDLGSREGVVAVHRLLRGHGWLLPGGGSWVDVAVVGFEGGVPTFFQQSREQQEDTLADGVLVPESILYRYGLQRGSLVELASPRPTLTPLGPRPRLHQVRIAGVFTAGSTEENEARVAVPFELARSLFGSGRQRLEVRAGSLEEALELAPRLAIGLPDGAVLRSWKDLNRGLFFALQLEKRLMFLSIFLIVPIAAMALVTVLALLVSAKRGEIGMLHALGATPRQVERAFFGLGSLLAGTGLVLGGLLGVLGSVLLDRFQLVAPPGDVYFVTHVPFRLEGPDLFGIFGATLLFTLASAWVAARRASAFRPVEALRNP
ncbi:MAG: FtsX-like permease family protein [Thermoanaerobaculia bacterium]|nr:FtsX-like permease family protein [Thermoanaerobaculia bacterium]